MPSAKRDRDSSRQPQAARGPERTGVTVQFGSTSFSLIQVHRPPSTAHAQHWHAGPPPPFSPLGKQPCGGRRRMYCIYTLRKISKEGAGTNLFPTALSSNPASRHLSNLNPPRLNRLPPRLNRHGMGCAELPRVQPAPPPTTRCCNPALWTGRHAVSLALSVSGMAR
jgi:hypothetical protein